MSLLSPAEWEAIAISARVAAAALGWILIPGIALAWLMARRDFPGKTLLDGLLHLPLVLPPVAVGYLLLIGFGPRGPVGQWLSDSLGVTLAFQWQGAALAAGVMALPLLVRSLRLSIEAVDPGLEAAALTLGAPPWRVFATVTLPLALPGLLTGSVLAFARALSEFGATITFAANIPGETRTLPLALYTAIQSPGGETAAARLCAIAIVIALLALSASEALARRARSRLQGRDA
jgi:molybdate transport system permease protein